MAAHRSCSSSIAVSLLLFVPNEAANLQRWEAGWPLRRIPGHNMANRPPIFALTIRQLGVTAIQGFEANSKHIVWVSAWCTLRFQLNDIYSPYLSWLQRQRAQPSSIIHQNNQRHAAPQCSQRGLRYQSAIKTLW